MSHFVKQFVRVSTDPLAYLAYNAAPTNDLAKIAFPGQATAERQLSGEGNNPSSLFHTAHDPGGFFTQTKAQKDRAAAELAAAPKAPNQDTASNAAQQQSDILRRRRGMLANIFGGGQAGSSTPTVGTKTLLGT